MPLIGLVTTLDDLDQLSKRQSTGVGTNSRSHRVDTSDTR